VREEPLTRCWKGSTAKQSHASERPQSAICEESCREFYRFDSEADEEDPPQHLASVPNTICERVAAIRRKHTAQETHHLQEDPIQGRIGMFEGPYLVFYPNLNFNFHGF
jgi:hypothetical protein